MATGVRDQNGETSGCEEPPQDGRYIVKWIESQTKSSQAQYTRERLDSLLLKASQPWYASKNACIELCYFIEQCRSSRSSLIQDVALAQVTALNLFNFYIESSEKTESKQPKQVLEVLASLIALHPEEKVATLIKESILQRLVLIITHQAAQPLVKPAFKALDFFLSKGTFPLTQLIDTYEKIVVPRVSGPGPKADILTRWDLLISDIFDWMALPDISPAAGKCLVSLFGLVRSTSDSSIPGSTLLWQRWIRNGLDKDPNALENVKIYLFPPLFKFDRSGSIAFLEQLNKQKPISDLNTTELNAPSLLQLVALEAGKKAGLVEEPSTVQSYKAAKKTENFVVLREDVIGDLTTCAVDTVRSLAFSVLVASPSPTRPFSAAALDILQSQMAILYADTDAKFRTDVLSNTRKMIERVRGATAYLSRELGNLSSKYSPNSSTRSEEVNELYERSYKLLQKHKAFIEWYLEFLLGELIPTVSYQRHITALKAIGLLLRSGILSGSEVIQPPKGSNNTTSWSYRVNFFTSRSMRLLLDLLMDPFEDVRSSATNILKMASTDDFAVGLLTNQSDSHKMKLLPIGQIIPLHEASSITDHRRKSASQSTSEQRIQAERDLGILTALITRAEELSKRTGRADYADGVARSFELLYSRLPSAESRLKLVKDLVHGLDTKIHIAERDLTQAVLDAPVHGTFAALNLVWKSIDPATDFQGPASEDRKTKCEEWANVHEFILLLCCRIWKEVKSVLCNDSPEGHLLDDINTVDTKDVLSYSFRAVHESSNLMRSMASKVTLTWKDGTAIIPPEVFKGIGELTFEQLSGLRHRGAFSTVALTFARCCQLTQSQLASEQLKNSYLLERWYQGTLACISEQASTTRRSAGIPALMTSILSANSDKPGFQDVMSDLKALARMPVQFSEEDETNLPQVHALNCLKEIFKSSSLGKKPESHIADCLQLAADSLNSDVWAVRNCGLLLLRSLIDSLFGTNESKALIEAGWDGRSIRLSYERYPSLPELLLKLLETDTSGAEKIGVPAVGAVESVFPALDIVRRAGPPPSHRDEIFKLVSMHLGSRIWHVREIAARTICTLLLHQDWLSAVTSLIVGSYGSTNHLHGVLMAVRMILERRLELDPLSATDGLLHISSMLKSPRKMEFFKGDPPEVLTAYLEVSNTIAKIQLSCARREAKKDDASLLRAINEDLFTEHSFENIAVLIGKCLEISTETMATAALANAIIHRGIYATALSCDEVALQNILCSAAALNTDVVLAALDCVPIAWKNLTSLENLLAVSQAYTNLLITSKAPEVRARVCYYLADILDKAFVVIEASGTTGKRSVCQSSLRLNDITEQLRTILPGNDNPSFSNARIRISGSILISEHISEAHDASPTELYSSRMKAWGQMLSVAGKASNDFDTRHAAAAALQSFYSHPQIIRCPPSECALQSLLALYDTLSDDDDEIRDLSALTVSKLLNKSLVPLAAQVELLDYVKNLYGQSFLFAWHVVFRMTGHDLQESETALPELEPVKVQFVKALKDDNSLFIEEEQNLFIDEVREANLWAKVFKEMNLHSYSADINNVWAQPYAALVSWVIDGLETMTGLLDKEDGPLGWTSRPAVFSSCMRVISSANAITKDHKREITSGDKAQNLRASKIENVILALERFHKLSGQKNIHESLLFGIQRNSYTVSELY